MESVLHADSSRHRAWPWWVGELFCGRVLCFKPYKEAIEVIEQRDVAVRSLWCRFIVCDHLDALPQALCVFAIFEMACCIVCVFAFLIPQDRWALAVLSLLEFLALKVLFLSFSIQWTSPVSHGFWLA